MIEIQRKNGKSKIQIKIIENSTFQPMARKRKGSSERD